MKKFLLLSLICVLVLCGCGKIPKLQNGEEAVITFSKDKKDHKISVDDLYNELKDKYGLEAVINMIDTYILETEFSSNVDAAKKEADSVIESLITSYGGEEAVLSLLQQLTNYQTIDAYRDAYYLGLLQSDALNAYAKSLVTDKEIEDYYKDEAKGDVEVYHILITPKVTDSMTATEKKEAEDAAKAKAEEVIKKLDSSKDKLEEFKKLVKEYSEDEATKDKDGNLGYINYGTLSSSYDELLDAVYKIKDGKYSKSVITTELGYHVVYRNASKEKDTLENLKESIIKTLADRKIEKDSKLNVKAMKYYRELYNVKITDSELDRQYGIYLNSSLNSSSTN